MHLSVAGRMKTQWTRKYMHRSGRNLGRINGRRWLCVLLTRMDYDKLSCVRVFVCVRVLSVR